MFSPKIVEQAKAYAEILGGLSVNEMLGILKKIGIGFLTDVQNFPDTQPEGVEKPVMTKIEYYKRVKACSECPLKNGNQCNPTKYRLHVSKTDANGIPVLVKGCGCRLSSKQKGITDHCPAGEW